MGRTRTLRVRIAQAWLACSAVAAAQNTAAAPASRPAPVSDEAVRAIAKYTLPKDFKAAAVASEPHIANIVSFAFDFRGDIYVAETYRLHRGVSDIRNHMDWCDEDLANRTVEERVEMQRRHEKERFAEDSEAEDRVRKLTDADGDGVYESDTVFAGGFREPASGIGSGVLSYKGNVYYTCIPSLWRLRDRDGDGTAEERKELSRGYGVHFAMIGHDLHGLRIGPDQRLYFSCGDRSFHVQTDDGDVDHTFAGGVVRCELDGSRLEVFASGLRNPQELAFDEMGNLFTGDNNSDGGDRARWVHVIQYSDSGWRYGYQWLTEPLVRGPWNDEKLWHPHHPGQAAYILPPLANQGSGPAGLTYYPGTGLTPEYQHHFFLCEFEGDPNYSGVFTFTVEPNGATFAPSPVQKFVWGSLATDCDFGPDGALYVSDWVEGWGLTGKARIARISHPDADKDATVARTRALLRDGMEKRSIGELEALLHEPDQRVRQEAHFELAARGADGAAALGRIAADDHDARARVHAIWGLGIAARHGTAIDASIADRLVEDGDAEVRAHACELVGELRASEKAKLLIGRLDDASPRVRLYAALALVKVPAPDATGTLLRALAETKETDPALRHGLVVALAACATPESLERLHSDASPDVRIGAIVALRRRRDPRVVVYLKDPDPRVALEAVRAVYDPPVSAAYPALAERLGEAKIEGNALARRVLGAAFRLGGLERAKGVAQWALRADLAEAHRVEALQVLARWNEPSGRDLVTGEWRPIERGAEEKKQFEAAAPEIADDLVAHGIASAPDAVIEAFISFLRRYSVVRAGAPMLAWAKDVKRSPRVRAASVAALEALRPDGYRDALAAALGDPDVDIRTAAFNAILKTAPEQSVAACRAALANGSVPEQRAAYAALARVGNAEADALLEDEAARLDARLVSPEAALELMHALGERWKDAPRPMPARAAAAKLDPELAPYLDAIAGGDAGRGRTIFKTKASTTCVRCHKSDDTEGGEVGPPLAGVGKRLSRLRLLESIVAPNRRIAPGYQATTFWLKSGQVAEGRVTAESKDSIQLMNSEGKTVTIAAADVQERKDALSAMPQNLAQMLTLEELRDVVDYLASLK